MFDYAAHVLKVIDGDTIEVVIELGFGLVLKKRLRLLRVNTSELKSDDPAEKSKAVKAKDALTKLLLNKEVKIHSEKFDSFGRYLAEVWIDDLNVNDWLLQNDLAKPYQK